MLLGHQCTPYFSMASSTVVSEGVGFPNLPRPAVGREKMVSERRKREAFQGLYANAL